MTGATQVVLPYWWNRPPTEAVAVGRRAEALGYEELWIGELTHFDAFALAGHLAAHTRRITLCVGPLAVGVRDPVTLARGVASVSVLGERPARLGLGASNPTVVSRFHGRPWAPPAEVMAESLAGIRQVLAGDKTDLGGDHLASHGYRSALGAQPAHLSVAAFGPRMLALAAAEADRVVLNLVTVDQAGRLAAGVADHARAAGREPPPVVTWLVAAVDPDDAMFAQIAAQLSSYLAAPGYADMFTAAGFGELVAAAREGAPLRELAARVPPELIEAVSAVGSAADVRRRVDQYRQVGVEPAIVPATASDPGGERTLVALRGD